jgi:hypothetical protein
MRSGVVVLALSLLAASPAAAQSRWVVCGGGSFATCATGFGPVPYLDPNVGTFKVWVWAYDFFNLSDYGGTTLISSVNQIYTPTPGAIGGPGSPPTVTPEPRTWVLLATGFLLVGIVGYRWTG